MWQPLVCSPWFLCLFGCSRSLFSPSFPSLPYLHSSISSSRIPVAVGPATSWGTLSDPPRTSLVEGLSPCFFFPQPPPFFYPVSTIWGQCPYPLEPEAARHPTCLVSVHPETDFVASCCSAFPFGWQCGDLGLFW